MQPYLFPYLGYFQLIQSVDEFIVYDNVQYMKGGWINRNRILEDGEVNYISLPVKKDSYRKFINERYFTDNIEVAKLEILDRIKNQYFNAPYFNSAYNVVSDILSNKEMNVSSFVDFSIRRICDYIGINTKIIKSSDLGDFPESKGRDRVVDICRSVGAKSYINAIGGVDLYDKSWFLDKGIDIKFIKSRNISYRQFDKDFIGGLSIVDVMMFNSPGDILKILDEYDLV